MDFRLFREKYLISPQSFRLVMYEPIHNTERSRVKAKWWKESLLFYIIV